MRCLGQPEKFNNAHISPDPIHSLSVFYPELRVGLGGGGGGGGGGSKGPG